MNILLFFAVLVVLIVVHELGHFLIAKLFKVRVDEFGVGYPPRAFTLGRIGETEYTLNWVPFGGFVRIFGESKDNEISAKDKKRALAYKNPFIQIAVLSGGVLFNAIFAWILFTSTFMLGAPAPVNADSIGDANTRLMISSVIDATPAAATDLKSGDTIVSVSASGGEDKPTSLSPAGVAEFIQSHGGGAIAFEVKHLASTTTETISVTPAHGVLSANPGTPAVGVAMNLISDEPMTFWRAVTTGLDATLGSFITVSKGLWTIVVSIFNGGINWNQVAGPVGIVGIVGGASAIGIVYLLNIIAFISINLSVINLLPLPALDGGRILFVIIETIIRRPLHAGVATWINIAGFGLLILFMLLVTYHDILKLITG